MDVPDVKPDTVGLFDVVLFLGVFYHLFDAQTLTRQVSACASDLLILETHQDAIDISRPAMVMYPGKILNNDPSNWWGPNPYCIYVILRECGFSKVFYQNYPGDNIDDPASPRFRQRGIYHAFRDDAALRRFIAFPDRRDWHDLGRPEEQDAIFAAPAPQADPRADPQAERIDALRRRAEGAERELAIVRQSRSWRWTALFRR